MWTERLLWLLLALSIAATAHAQEPGSAGAESKPEARADEAIRAGVELRHQGREREAFERFREAHALHPSARALGQMGLAAKSMRLYVEAEQHLSGALAATDDPWVRQNREALERARDIVSGQLASLVVVSNVAGAELFVNGAPVAKLPLDAAVRVPAGALRLELRAEGHRASLTEATLPAGQTTALSLALEQLPAAKSAASPPARADAPGTRRQAPPADTKSSRLPWIVGAAGVGAIGVGLGTYFGLRSLSEKEERDRLCGDGNVSCASQEGPEHDRAARSAATWSTVTFAVGAVGVGAALVLILLEPRSSGRAQRRALVKPGWSF